MKIHWDCAHCHAEGHVDALYSDRIDKILALVRKKHDRKLGVKKSRSHTPQIVVPAEAPRGASQIEQLRATVLAIHAIELEAVRTRDFRTAINRLHAQLALFVEKARQ